MKQTILVLAALLTMGPAWGAEPSPTPDREPGEVVGVVLSALQHPDQPRENAGIATAFRFAAPANRAQTGPLPRFVRLLKNPHYAPLLGYRRVLRGNMEVDGDRARERVRVIAKDGSLAVFAFILQRQPEEADCGGCWMTEAVIRLQSRGQAT